MFNRITTLALATISTQAVKLLSQVDAEADAELGFGPAAAWGALCLSNPNPPAECGFGLAQTDAEAKYHTGPGVFAQTEAE